MAIKSFTYLDIPSTHRRKTAAMALNRLKEHQSDPTLTEEQRQLMRERALHLENWVAGTLAVVNPESEES